MPLKEHLPPDYEGPYARAWRPTFEPANVDQTAALGAWIVHYPQSHPLWPTYQFALITLADIPGVRPANKDYAEAEYEFMIVALDPDGTEGHSLSTNDVQSWRHLTPINVRVQFDNGGRDDAAIEVLDLAVKHVCEKGIGIEPDDDARVRPYWTDLIRNTADHTLGAHEPFAPEDGQHR